MRRFVNRTRELTALRGWWDDPGGGHSLVWGRRRVGKTYLLQEFAEDKPTVFHTGAGRPKQQELQLISLAASPLFASGIRDPAQRPFTDWDDALDSLAQLARNEPVLLVLDEFPELVRTSPELPGVLRAFIDRASGQTRLRVIVCGSAVRTMEAMQEERSPLYGRFSLTLQVHPFTAHGSALMLPKSTPETRAVVWGLLGGIPLYLSWWDEDSDLGANIRRLFCEPGAPLLNEGRLVLATEGDLSDLSGQIIRAIAFGKTKHNEIADSVGTEPARALDRLIELKLVERMVPVTDDPRKSKKRLYRVGDRFLLFWLRVVERYKSDIERGLEEAACEAITASVDDFMGASWESAFRQELRRRSEADEVEPRLVAVGPWWSRDGSVEIDAVGLRGRSREVALVGEAEWSSRVDGQKLYRALVREATELGGDPAELTYAIGARTEVEHAPPGTVTVTARDIFARR